LQGNDDLVNKPTEDKAKAQKELVEGLKVQWKLLWNERITDEVRAEGISVANYESLRVERGTIIQATRDFKPLNFKEILETHMVENPERYIQPDRREGGWGKFVKNEIIKNQGPKTKRAQDYAPKKPKGKQAKKSGRGWLHAP
jgi:hypothetical protein